MIGQDAHSLDRLGSRELWRVLSSHAHLPQVTPRWIAQENGVGASRKDIQEWVGTSPVATLALAA